MKFVVILAVATVVAAQFAYGKADQTDSSNDQSNRPAMPPIEMRGPSSPGQRQDQAQGQRQGFIRKIRQAPPPSNTTMIPTTTTATTTTTTNTTTTDSTEECGHGGHRGHKRGRKH